MRRPVSVLPHDRKEPARHPRFGWKKIFIKSIHFPEGESTVLPEELAQFVIVNRQPM